jgi:hypothetical protein
VSERTLSPPDPAPTAVRLTPRWPIVAVRALSVVVLLQVLVQAALAGGFVTGDVGLLDLHSVNGILLVLTTAALLPAAVLLLRPGRGPWWPIAFSVVLWWLVAVQVGFGFARQVGLHIPLGVTIMSLVSGFTWWSFLYRGPGLPRGRAEDRGAGR